MAEVMQPLVQSSSMSMLQPRSNTADGQSYQHAQRPSQSHRASFSPPHNAPAGQYRATATAPVQPYAFQATPGLRQEHRTHSASGLQGGRSAGTSVGSTSEKSTLSSSPASSISASKEASREDVSATGRPHSIISLSSSIPDLSLHNFDATPKASPERYRRSSSRKIESSNSVSALPTLASAAPSGSGMSSVEHLYIPPPAPRVNQRTASDDQHAAKNSEAAKRYRRRSSMAGTETAGQTPGQSSQRPGSSSSAISSADRNTSPNTIRPVSSHSRHGSADSLGSHDGETSRRRAPPSPIRSPRKDTGPVRASTDNHKRVATPSPLSRSAFSSENAAEQNNEAVAARASPTKQQSPAAQQLAALSDKDLNKGMKSRLRRAFSFGSAAELRKAAAPRPLGENVAPSISRLDDSVDGELDDEQNEVARRQEAAGIGAGIYSGQGGFSGSTDNLSISSTASSASVMLRKMGKGMKKGGRSLKGLFRPKSVIGVPAADGPIQPSLAEVSMVTVEAERQRVNVNATVSDQSDGGTGFPKLEKNSLDASVPILDARPTSSERNDSLRKSIVGSEKERAEVLAAVKKGILKRSGTGSPQASPVIRAQNAPFTDAPTTASPAGSAPGTPKDERKSRSLSSTNSSNDYFSQRLVAGSRSMPQTPQSSRNISFSPRIQFHDVWSSTEYDRRGEIATCNRLTPMLAQQIKEELNTFKMEMEVHEASKPHTHFF